MLLTQVLFNRSVRDNITYGLQWHPTDAQVEKAAKLAHAHEFISEFADGYNTQPGEKVNMIVLARL